MEVTATIDRAEAMSTEDLETSDEARAEMARRVARLRERLGDQLA